MSATKSTPAFALITMPLPGPDRKRTPSYYHYRTTFRNHDSGEPGCVMTWEVLGGREPYQITLEQTAGGRYRWHCTCADAVYRGEVNPHHVCKHVQGLTALLPPAGAVPPGSPITYDRFSGTDPAATPRSSPVPAGPDRPP